MSNYKNGNKTRIKILEASKKLFYENGYKNTRIEMIGKSIDKPKSLVNYHFHKKSDILVVIMQDFQQKIYDYVLSSLDCKHLIKYFVCNKAYYHLLNYDSKTTKFSQEVLNTTDRTIDTYKNFQRVFRDLIKYMKLDNITNDNLILKEISFLGSNRELMNNYYKGTLDMTLDDVINLININSCKLFGISNIKINEYSIKSDEMYNSLDFFNLKLF
ncbi:MAG: TetR/AcrR family transcriptional regulator [Eubacteriaceae bacterium]